MQTSRLRHNIARMLSGNIVFALSQWGLIIVLAKYEGAETLGVYALANAITAPVFAFTNLGLRQSLATDIKELHTLSSYLSLYMLVSIIAFISCIGVANISGITGVSLFVLIALAVARIAENGSSLYYGLFQRYEKIYLVSRSLALRGGLGFLFFFVLIKVLDLRVDIAVFGLAFSWLAILLFYDIPKSRQLDGAGNTVLDIYNAMNSKDIRILFYTVLPLGMLALVTSLVLNIPRYFIENIIGSTQLGYFAAIVQLASIGAIIVNAIGQTIMPRLAVYYNNDRSNYIFLLTKAVLLAFGVGVCGFLVAYYFGEIVLIAFYSESFADHNLSLVLAMVWTTMLYISVTLGCGLSAIRSFRSQFVIGVFSLVFTLLLSWLLVEQYAINGAILALIIGVIIRIVGQLIAMSYLIPRNSIAG